MRKTIIFLAKLLLSAGAVFLIGQRTDLGHAFSLIAIADPTLVVAGLVMLLVQSVLAALRWRTILAALGGKRYDTSEILAWYGMSTLFSQALPSTIGGDAFRIGATARDIGLGASVRTVLLDRAVGLTVLALLACAGALVAGIQGLSSDVVSVSFAVGAAGILATVALGACAYLPAAASRWQRSLARLGADFIGLARGPQGPSLVAISLTIHGLSIAVLLVLASAVGVRPDSTGGFIALVPGVLLVSAIPISIAGWGVREGAMIVAMGALGVAGEGAFAVSVLFGIAMIAVGLVGGLLWLTIGRQPHKSPDNVVS